MKIIIKKANINIIEDKIKNNSRLSSMENFDICKKEITTKTFRKNRFKRKYYSKP